MLPKGGFSLLFIYIFLNLGSDTHGVQEIDCNAHDLRGRPRRLGLASTLTTFGLEIGREVLPPFGFRPRFFGSLGNGL